MNPELLKLLLAGACAPAAVPAAPAATPADPRAALVASLLGTPAPAAPAPAAMASHVEGPLRRFRSGTLLGDLRVQRLPQATWLPGKTKKDGDFMTSATIWSGTAHIGPHGRAWVTDLVDTGVPYVPNGAAADDTDFDAALAAAQAAVASANTDAAPADAAPTV